MSLPDFEPSLSATLPVADIGHVVALIRGSSASSGALLALSNGIASLLENAPGSVTLTITYKP